MSRKLSRMALVGAVCAFFVVAAGLLLQRGHFGADDAESRARIERDLRGTFDAQTRELKTAALGSATAALMRGAADGSVTATRQLFAAAQAQAGATRRETAITVYNADRQPVAWAGRPSELPTDRLSGGEAWFFIRTGQGLRIIYVSPILDGRVRLGVVASEQVVAGDTTDARAAATVDDDGSVRVETRIASVTIEVPPFEGASTQSGTEVVELETPTGGRLLSARVAANDIRIARERWETATWSLATIVVGLGLLMMTGPLLDARHRPRSVPAYATTTLAVAALIIGARLAFRLASPADWADADIFSGAIYASPLLPPFLTSPFDLLVDVLTGAALTGLALIAVERFRLVRAQSRWAALGHPWLYVGSQLAAGVGVAIILIGYQELLADTIAHSTLDLLHFSLHPWNTARLGLQVGLVIAHAVVAAMALLCLRLAAVGWRVSRRAWRLRLAAVAAWATPLLVWQTVGAPTEREFALLIAMALVLFGAHWASRLQASYRHGSQAYRLALLTLALLVPSFAFYPTQFQLARAAKAQLVETRFAPQARDQRATVQSELSASLDQIDDYPLLADLVSQPAGDASTDDLTSRAFQVWQITALAAYPITSSVELYGPTHALVSRFAFNLPEDPTAAPVSDERTCDWDLYEEVAPFFADERRVLHAGRALCIGGDPNRIAGSVVVHAMLDYENLPFIQSENPYVELLRPQEALTGEGVTGRDVDFAFYGWTRRPYYSSADTAWQIDDAVFARVQQSRDPFWTELQRGDDAYDVLLLNDRGGIYALGFPMVSMLGHLVNLAELTVLVFGTFLLLLAGNVVFGLLARRTTTAPALLREIRASFYRKLFLAFVAAVFFPVAALALVTRQYVADEIRDSVAQEAVRTAGEARRIVEDLVAPRATEQGVQVDDNLMVWVSRLIDQDVNIFTGPRLTATSERNLFASGLLPMRIPSQVYERLMLRDEAAAVTRERVASIDYLVAGTPITVQSTDAIVTVPLTSRELQIEAQIDTFDRRVLLAALLFTFAGAALGYRMAEQIADPVNRLTRATRWLARGEFDVQILGTSSDELRRLVDDFNGMATELKRQRAELERTHRLEAWAEMARQVAHDIKNPLTPIQLNAEHLRRVHVDRGSPLGPIVKECTTNILDQVRLLRQISSEFSNFASSPTAHPTIVDVPAMLHEIVDPYRTALAERIEFVVRVDHGLPSVFVDRGLTARALTNVIENALHAMPRGGTLSLYASATEAGVQVAVTDTGMGIDPEALTRIFEPYFSTKASGTGLGLPIARRNVELSGGSVAVTSVQNEGTTVTLTLPRAGQRAEAPNA